MLTLTVWQKRLAENLFKDDMFLDKCFVADEYVTQGKIVVIPQAGAKVNVEKNRSSLPATVTKRTDNDIVYVIDEYTTDPQRIDNAEIYELSYDKWLSLMSEQIDTLREVIADQMLYEWQRSFAYTGAGTVAAATVIRTSGAAVGYHMPGASGNRKKFVKEDLQAARTLMNKQKVPKGDRYALMSSDMMDQLMSDADLLKRDYAGELDMKNGIITRLFGFNLMERSDVSTYDNAATPVIKAPGSVTASTDNDAVLCWQKNAVERAVGSIKTFNNNDDPTYYGSIVSNLVRVGGRKRRIGAEGVLAIVQAASA